MHESYDLLLYHLGILPSVTCVMLLRRLDRYHASCVMCYRVAELELLREREHGEHDKLERLEACSENLVKGLQTEHDKVCSVSEHIPVQTQSAGLT